VTVWLTGWRAGVESRWLETVKAMYAIQIESQFEAEHQLRLYDGQLERLHAHQWRVRAVMGCEDLDELDMVVDFNQAGEWLERAIKPLVGGGLGEALGRANPSAERVAEYIYQSLAVLLPDRVVLKCVLVMEAEGCWASFGC